MSRRSCGPLFLAAVGIAIGPGISRPAAGADILFSDNFQKGKVGQAATTAGWTLDNSRGKSRWLIAEDGVCRVHHTRMPYSQDSISHKVELPARYYIDFEARFSEHAGLSLVVAAGRVGTAFHGTGKAVLWKVPPQQGRGWRTVPRPIVVGEWHRYRILVDADRKRQEFYVDDMTRPVYQEEGLDLLVRAEGKKQARHVVEFRDYGLVQKPVVNELRNVKLAALKPDEQPPANSVQIATKKGQKGPTSALIWRRPGRADSPHPREPFSLGKDAELFVDDYLIESAENVTRQLNKPQPVAGNPVLTPDQPWENGHIAFPSVRFVDGEFRMWYLSWGLNHPARMGKGSLADSSFLCYATSRDGIHWTRPKLGHIEFRGSRENNIVLRHEGSHFDSFSVFHHPGEEYPFKMLAYQGRWPYKEPLIQAKGYKIRIKEHGHFPFRSKDGVRWEYIQSEPKPVWGGDRSSAGYDVRRKKYLGF